MVPRTDCLMGNWWSTLVHRGWSMVNDYCNSWWWMIMRKSLVMVNSEWWSKVNNGLVSWLIKKWMVDHYRLIMLEYKNGWCPALDGWQWLALMACHADRPLRHLHRLPWVAIFHMASYQGRPKKSALGPKFWSPSQCSKNKVWGSFTNYQNQLC